MAFETSTLVNGEWTTRTLDVDTVLRHYNQKDKEATTTFMEVENAPTIGLLTQTVIRSPLVHWILPVKLRDIKTQHVAFIGVRIFLRQDPFHLELHHLFSIHGTIMIESSDGMHEIAKVAEKSACNFDGSDVPFDLKMLIATGRFCSDQGAAT